MGKTLYVSDLDGTLLRGDEALSGFTLDTVNGLIRKGLLFTYATARSFATASKVTAGLELCLPVILNNGVFLADAGTGRRHYTCTMDIASIRPVTNFLEREHISALFYAIIGGNERVSWLRGTESAGVANYIKHRPGDSRLRGVSAFEGLLEGELFYITIIENRENAKKLWEACSRTAYVSCSLVQDTYFPNEWWVEIYRHDVSKAAAVRRLKEMLHADRVVCFGDNANDIPMFSQSDEGYAVANARDELKAVSTGVIGGNEQDGVARSLLQNSLLWSQTT